MTAVATVQQLGTILGVWAHPDDEVFTCGGIMAIARENGQRVVCASATKGEAGIQDTQKWPAENLAQIREQELLAAYHHLGIEEHHWFGYADGKLIDIDEEEGVNSVLTCIDSCEPDSILTFGPEGMTGHPDHQTISRWATIAAARRGVKVYYAVLTGSSYEKYKAPDQKFDMFFNIDKPPIVSAKECAFCIDLPEDALAKKCSALKVMQSQTERLFGYLGDDGVSVMVSEEAFILP